MNADIKLGHIWGIPIGLNSSWFLIFALLTFSLAGGLFPAAFPGEPGILHWLLAAVTSVFFFGSVLLHELGHAYAAQRGGLRVRGITLFLFGGVAQLDQDSRTAGEELRIAIAGPLVSLGLAALFSLTSALAGGTYLGIMSLWLGSVNLSLALFNLIPGFPLDGGRVLKAGVWWWTKDAHRATQIAAGSGQLVAYGFMGIGLWTMLSGGFINGLWLIMIGWFLQNAARSSVLQSQLERALTGVRVRDVMSHVWAHVSEQTPLRYLVDMQALRRGDEYFLVGDAERFTGLVTVRDIAAVPRQDWGRVLAQQIMTPWERVTRVAPDVDLMDALRTMQSAQVQQLPVTEDGHVVGMLTREQIVRHLRVREALG